jgi:hypothetical protein
MGLQRLTATCGMALAGYAWRHVPYTKGNQTPQRCAVIAVPPLRLTEDIDEAERPLSETLDTHLVCRPHDLPAL